MNGSIEWGRGSWDLGGLNRLSWRASFTAATVVHQEITELLNPLNMGSINEISALTLYKQQVSVYELFQVKTQCRIGHAQMLNHLRGR